MQLDGLGTRDFITLDGETTVFDAMQRMLQADVRLALVRGPTDSTRKSGEPTPTIDGVITLEQLGRAWLRAAELH